MSWGESASELHKQIFPPQAPKGPSTYLHAGAGIGWPHDHSAEDTFCVPPMDYTKIESRIVAHMSTPDAPEYRAEFGADGSARLLFTRTSTIATFDTFADAQLAAKALNEHKGY